ncbi:MAG: PAS domain-containing protein [Planctomycetaceae bacterium]
MTSDSVNQPQSIPGDVRDREWLRLLIEQVPAVLWTTDADLVITSGAGAGLRGLGLAPNQLNGTRLQDYLGSEDRTFVPLEVHYRALAGESVTVENDWKGNVFEVRVEPLRDAAGAIVGCVGLALDITQRHRSEQSLRAAHAELEIRVAERTAELRTSRAQLQAILDHTPAVVFIKDLAGRYLLVNRRHVELFGVAETEMVGRTDHQIFPPEIADSFIANDALVLRTGEARSFEEIAPHPGGVPHTYVSLKFPFHDADGRPYALCGISTDITDRIRAEEELRRHREEVSVLARRDAMGRMAAELAHELNQPLEAAAGFADGALLRLEGGRPADLETLDKLRIAADQIRFAGGIVRRIRGHIGRRSVQTRPVDFDAIIRDLLSLFARDLRQRGIEVEYDPAESLPPADADPLYVEQVLHNLARNALEAMEETPPEKRRLRIGTRFDNGSVRCVLHDHGPGISSEAAARLFEMYFTTKPHGLGVGLAVSRSLLEAQGGELTFGSGIDGGAAFHFSLPASVAAAG